VKIAESAGNIDSTNVIKNPCGFIGPSVRRLPTVF
jgi:hypothetical protein